MKDENTKDKTMVEQIEEVATVENFHNKVYIIRGQQVMLDFDLAEIYGYEVKRLNEQVKRNIVRFPEDFMFQLTRQEIDIMKSQFATSRKNNIYKGQEGGRRKLPYAFTEQAYHCGASSKDAGKKLCAINKLENSTMVHPVIETLLSGEDKKI